MIKKYSRADLRKMSPSQLIAIAIHTQEEYDTLRAKYLKLKSAVQGYLLGINQLNKHLSSVKARTKKLIAVENEEGLIL